MDTSAEMIEKIKSLYQLKPLPVEGGWFAETYRSSDEITPEGLPWRYPPESKPLGTAIFYLLTTDPDCFSALHQLPTPEIYHFYLGDPVEMLLLFPDSHSEHVILGQDILHQQYVQYVVPRGVWQGSRLAPGGKYALLGTTMAPGYTASDYVGGERSELEKLYPKDIDMIEVLTRT
jgi:uncharacterized protein